MHERRAGKLFVLNVFPMIQLVLFVGACMLVGSHPVLAAAAVVLSAVALNFSIHICLHEYLHHSDRRPLPHWANAVYTIVAGLPFDGYRLHHHNHHKFDNGPLDYSCTYRITPRGKAPICLWRYALGWPAQLRRARRDMAVDAPASPAAAVARTRIVYQKWVLVCTLVGLIALSWIFALLYIAMIYLGWVLISVHNYGQHPPEADYTTTSFSSRLYNRLFFNNGLHYEHHAEPGKAWYELTPDERATQIQGSHLVAPLRGRKAVKP